MTAYTDLLQDWEKHSREHAESIREAATAALHEAVSGPPSVADWLLITGQETTCTGPWVRVYDATASSGEGAYAWVNGRSVIADHTVIEARMTGTQWDAIQALFAGWPAKPCSESYAEHPADQQDPQSYDDDHEVNVCPGCESSAPLIRYNDVWERVPHRVDGTRINPDD